MSVLSTGMKALFRQAGCIFALLFVALPLVGCRNAVESPVPVTSSGIPTGQINRPYLGQEPPGIEPMIFAPGIVSDPDYFEYSGTFSPDGTEYYFYRYSKDSPSNIYFTKVEQGEWSLPEPCAFTGSYSASEPHLTPDNKRLYFMWERPELQGQPGYNEEIKYYFVERTPGGWSEPHYAGQGMFLSSSRDGQIFTTDMSARNTSGRTYLSRVTTDNGVFTNYEKIDIKAHFGEQAHPCIAPDGSYLIFDVKEGAHLFVSFKQADGTWGEAIDLTEHGFDPGAGGACVSPDGRYLFFCLKDDIWWVDIKIVEGLKLRK